MDDAQWTTLVSMMPAARKARRGDRVANQMGQPSAVAEFRQQLASYRQKYPTLFTTGGDGGVRLLLAVDKANSDDGEVVLEEYDEPDRRKEEKVF